MNKLIKDKKGLKGGLDGTKFKPAKVNLSGQKVAKNANAKKVKKAG